ncbi:MAG: SDR family oxidoreductase [Archangium sp.]
MMLKDKIAVIYGAAGGLGTAIARSFIREGATVHLVGRNIDKLKAIEPGRAQVAQVDALDEKAIASHLESLPRVDVSVNAIGVPNTGILGVPLAQIERAHFEQALTSYLTTYFLTARHAARRMIAQKSGVIMTLTALHSRMGLPLVGGYGPAMAAKEALTRDLSVELAPHGIRVVGLRPQAVPESATIRDAFEARRAAVGMTWEQWKDVLASRTHGKRLMTLDEVADTAAFVASDRGSGFTGTTLNLTMGSLDD